MNRRFAPYLFVGPAMLLLATFGVFPILVAGFVSLTNMNISGLARWSNVKFVGFANYWKLFRDPDFWQALWNTVFFVGLGVPSVVLLSLMVALLMNRSGGPFFKALRAFYSCRRSPASSRSHWFGAISTIRSSGC